MGQKTYNYLANFVDSLQAEGRYSFTFKELRRALPPSDDALRLSLSRLVHKGKIISVRKGFYVILPPANKLADRDFGGDMTGLLRPGIQFNMMEAFELVNTNLIDKLK